MQVGKSGRTSGTQRLEKYNYTLLVADDSSDKGTEERGRNRGIQPSL